MKNGKNNCNIYTSNVKKKSNGRRTFNNEKRRLKKNASKLNSWMDPLKNYKKSCSLQRNNSNNRKGKSKYYMNRSEERRVGKEERKRWGGREEKKKKKKKERWTKE